METKKTLYRDTDDKILGGVASGLAAFFNWDISVMRFAFVLGWLSIPSFTLAYILAWIIIPRKNSTSNQFGLGKLILILFTIHGQNKKVGINNLPIHLTLISML